VSAAPQRHRRVEARLANARGGDGAPQLVHAPLQGARAAEGPRDDLDAVRAPPRTEDRARRAQPPVRERGQLLQLAW
jgi:hypothetical protein